MMINGRLIMTSKIDKEMPVNSEVIKEIPVTPPSINEFGSRKPFSPKLAETTPSNMKNISCTI